MKKLIALILALVMCLSLVACGANEPEAPTEPSAITLTKANILDYVVITGLFTDYKGKESLGWYYLDAKIDLGTYATTPGMFDNVKITVRINMAKYNDYDDFWRLSDLSAGEWEEDYIDITFVMPANGNYSQQHEIKYSGLNLVPEPVGNCDISIVSVSGEFIPQR